MPPRFANRTLEEVYIPTFFSNTLILTIVSVKQVLERWDGMMWTGLVWLRIGTGGELL
jgi:hypothetical protein